MAVKSEAVPWVRFRSSSQRQVACLIGQCVVAGLYVTVEIDRENAANSVHAIRPKISDLCAHHAVIGKRLPGNSGKQDAKKFPSHKLSWFTDREVQFRGAVRKRHLSA